MRDTPLIRSWLYAPGNNPRLLEKVFAAGADAVILDLEDAVPPAEKDRARELVAEAVHARRLEPRPTVFVRVNRPDSGRAEEDIHAVVQAGLAGLRVPKVENAETVRHVHAWLAAAETDAGLPVGALPIVCNVESASGVWHAGEIASASPRVLALAYGAADFERDVNLAVGPDQTETLYARSRLVIASRVAGVRAPVDSVYRHIEDDEGLGRTSRQARALGYFGRSTIHPRQVPIVNAVFTPTDAELTWAGEVVEAAAEAERSGSGALRLPGGEFVDVAVVRKAQHLLRLAESLRDDRGAAEESERP